MANPRFRDGCWLYLYRDRFGKWRSARMKGVTSKAEAKRLNVEKQRLEDRIRHGLEKPPAENADASFGALLDWWLDKRMKGTASHRRNAGSLRKHLIGWSPPANRGELDVARLPPGEVTPGRLTDFLTYKKAELAPATLNNLRAWIRAAVNASIEAGRFHGKNPVTKKGVKPQRVPKRKPRFLPAEWIPLILDDVPAKYRGIFASGIYAGLRKGEILGLLKTDVDIARGQIIVRRTVAADETKGGHEEGIPIADELLPYLQEALDSAPGPLVFPRADGSPYPELLALAPILRASLRRLRLGITGYEMICRRRGCGYRVESADGAPGHCPAPRPAHRAAGEGAPRCGFRLWPCAIVPGYVFHDTRHSTASHLLMKGADAAAVQRVMRHRDIRVTTEVYGHLSPEYLRSEIALLSFRPKDAVADVPAAMPVAAAAGSAPAAGSAGDHGAPVGRNSNQGGIGASEGAAEAQPIPRLPAERDNGFEPSTFSLGKARPSVEGLARHSKPLNIIRLPSPDPVQRSKPFSSFERRFGAPVGRGDAAGSPPSQMTAGGSRPAVPATLLTVKQVAAQLGVSTATVYKLCEEGRIRHVRIAGAIRILPEDVSGFVYSRRR